MRFQAVPNQDSRILNMSTKFLQKSFYPRAVDIRIRSQRKIKPYTTSLRRYGKGSNGGHLLPIMRSLMQQRSFSSGRPTPAYQGGHQQARFIQEDKRSPQSTGVFFIRGQSCLIQRWMACSSRSWARRSGFWGVQPMDRSKRQIWST